MANTYTLIASNTLSSSAASVTFSSIPATYTDLVLRWSARSGSTTRNVLVTFNGTGGTSYSSTLLYSDGATPASIAQSFEAAILTVAGMATTTTADTFNNAELYIPSYTSSNKKPVSIGGFNEANNTTSYISLTAGLANITSAITSLTLTTSSSTFVSGSSFYLYGIKNS